MYSNLVTVKNNKFFIDSYTIAENTNNLHNGVLQLIEKHIPTCKFEISTSIDSLGRKNKDRRIAILTEKEATFLMTLFRNNEIVVNFKKKLVDAFFEARERIKAQNQVAVDFDPQNLSKLLITAGQELEKKNLIIQEKDREIAEIKPKEEFYDRVIKTNKWLDFEAASKILALGMGRNKLFNFLRNKNVIMKGVNRPYQYYVDRGLFIVRERPYIDNYGMDRISLKTMVSQKGLDFIMRLCKREEKTEGD